MRFPKPWAASSAVFAASETRYRDYVAAGATTVAAYEETVDDNNEELTSALESIAAIVARQYQRLDNYRFFRQLDHRYRQRLEFDEQPKR